MVNDSPPRLDALLNRVDHRPFPVPKSKWVMSQAWCKLLFAHWAVPPGAVRQLVPGALELDLFDGKAWIGIVPFAMREVYPRYTFDCGWFSNFLELNVRTYVVKDGVPGVYFFSLDCSNPLAVLIARKFYHLPYYNASMSLREEEGKIIYSSERLGSMGKFLARYWSNGARIEATEKSIDKFLTERYCLYATDPSGKLWRGIIHHEQWPLQTAGAEIIENTMTETLGLALPPEAPLLHYVERLDTIEWPLISV